MPATPRDNLFQPIIEQTFCDKNGENCQVKSFCSEWHLDESSNKWVLVAKHPLKKCHGIFGVNSTGVTNYQNYFDKMSSWIENNCKVK